MHVFLAYFIEESKDLSLTMLNYAKQIFYGNQKTNINIVDIRTDKSYNFSLSLRGNNFFHRRHFYCISIGDCNQLEGLV